MTMKSITEIPAGQFKAKCLALLDRVQRTGETITVTKHGRPVASVVPVRPRKWKSMRGSAKILGDIMTPPWGTWEMDR